MAEDFAYPSFVKSVADPKEGGHLHENIDCWSPDRAGYPALDYAEGRRHFVTAQSVAAAYTRSGFLFNVLTAMMVHRHVGDIEAGFIDALASRAAVGCRPAAADFGEPEMDEKLRALEDAIWNVIRDDPGGIPLFLRDAIVNGGTASVVVLFVIAATAFNGARN